MTTRERITKYIPGNDISESWNETYANRPKKNYHFFSANMKTRQQIQERIKFLESRQKDGVPVEDTLIVLRWALLASE